MHIIVQKKVVKSCIAIDRVSDKIQISIFQNTPQGFVGGVECDTKKAKEIIKAIENYIKEIEKR